MKDNKEIDYSNKSLTTNNLPLTTITIKPLEHKGTQVVGIYFEKDIKLNIVLQKTVAAKWSRSKKCWYM